MNFIPGELYKINDEIVFYDLYKDTCFLIPKNKILLYLCEDKEQKIFKNKYFESSYHYFLFENKIITRNFPNSTNEVFIKKYFEKLDGSEA